MICFTCSKCPLVLSAVLLLLAAGAAGVLLLMTGSENETALNLGFEQVVDSSGTPRYWRTTQRAYDVTTDASVVRSGECSLRIRFTGHSPDGRSGVAVWAVSGRAASGKTVRLAGWIRTDEAAREEAHLVLSVRAPGSEVLSADTAKTAAGGAKGMLSKQGAPSERWQRYVAEVEVPQGAKEVVFQASLDGWGTAWFDDLSISIGDARYEPPASFRVAERQVEWLRSEAIPFETTDPARGLSDLMPMTEVVGEARLAGLGEGTHGTKEFFQMKHRLTKLLAKEKGFTVFAIEANMPEARQVNRYIQTGEGDPREALDGLHFWTVATEEVLALIEWMREYNASDKGCLSFWGFDMQFPSVAMDSVKSFADRYAAPAYADSVAQVYGTIETAWRKGRRRDVSNANVYDSWHWKASRVLAHLEGRRTAYRAAGADSSEVAWAVQNARLVRQAAGIHLSQEPSRDELMARNVTWIIEHAQTSAKRSGVKAVLWAHNGHVEESKDGRAMGYYLSQREEKYLSVGFAFHEGRYTAVGDEGIGAYGTVSSEPGSIEQVFHRMGLERFVIDLRKSERGDATSGWLRKELLHRRIGAVAQPWAFLPATPAEVYDAMVYVEESTPSRLLQE